MDVWPFKAILLFIDIPLQERVEEAKYSTPSTSVITAGFHVNINVIFLKTSFELFILVNFELYGTPHKLPGFYVPFI